MRPDRSPLLPLAGRLLMIGTIAGVFVIAGTFAGCTGNSTVGEAVPFTPSDTLCLRFGCTGEYVGGITWKDARGENLFFLTADEKEIESGRLQRLHAWRYALLERDAHRQTWAWSEEAENWCDPGEGLLGAIELTDLNDDGVGEVSWVYNVAGNCDVSPREFGLVMHTGVGSGAYEITGTDNRQIYGDIPGAGRRTLSPSLAAAPDTFRVWTAALWRRHVPEE